MHLVERDGHLKVLAELLSASSRGTAKVALVSGAIAMGKTTMLSAFAHQATGSGAVFAGVSASPAEQSLPFGVLDPLLRSVGLPTEFTERADGLLDAATLSAFLRDPELPREESRGILLSSRWIGALCESLRDLAARRTLVLAIDNAHYVDEESLVCLSYLMRRLKSSRVLMVLTADPFRIQHSLTEAELLSDPDAHRLRLEPLSTNGVKDMLAEHVDPQMAETASPAIRQASGGNPLLAAALINDLRSYPATSTRLVTGDAFDTAVASCLHRSVPQVRKVAHALAVGDADFPVSLVGQATGLGPVPVDHAIEMLAAMGFVVGRRFRHEAIRAAILRSMPVRARRKMRQQVALILHEHSAPPGKVAPHLIDADQAPSSWAVQVLQDAAEETIIARQPVEAIRYLRLAIRCCDQQPQRVAVVSQLALAEWQVVPSVAARHLPELAEAVRTDQLHGRHVNRLIKYLLWFGRSAEAGELLDMLFREETVAMDISSPPVDQTSLRSWVAFFSPDLLGAYPEVSVAAPADGPSSADANAATVRTAGQPVRQDAPVSDGGINRSGGAELKLAAFGIDEAALSDAVIQLTTLMCRDQYEKAALYCEKVMAEDTVTSVPAQHSIFSATYAAISLGLGNVTQAHSHASLALSLISPAGWGAAVGAPLGSLVLAVTLMGRYKDAAAYLQIPVPPTMLQAPLGAYYLYARGRYHLAVGRFTAARDDFHACGTLMTRWGLDTPALIPWRIRAAEAWLGMDEWRRAKDLLEQQLASPGAGLPRVLGACLRTRAALDDLACRPETLRQAVGLLNQAGDQAEVALALADLSQAHDTLGESRRARIAARRARLVAKQYDLTLNRSLIPDADDAGEDLTGDTDDASQRHKG